MSDWIAINPTEYSCMAYDEEETAPRLNERGGTGMNMRTIHLPKEGRFSLDENKIFWKSGLVGGGGGGEWRIE